jgi:diguanylate cyclase (GGDEF)-like protein/PAS domain S-box-containing protein
MAQHVLLVQDDEPGIATIKDALRATADGSFTVECVGRCDNGIERLAKTDSRDGASMKPIAAVMLDLNLPDSFGLATFDRLFRAAPQVPILVLSASRDEADGRAAVERGAQDYLLKERVDSYSLPKALHGVIERSSIAEALFAEKERAQITLNSIGDAVMSTDASYHITYLNSVAEKLTGWSQEEAFGRPIDDVLRIADADTGAPAQNPMALAIEENRTVSLASNCVLVRRDASESAIEDSAAPIHDRRGQVTGAVMVFRDVSGARAQSRRMAYLAQHDSLTDLPNRVLLRDRLTQAVTAAHRHQHKVAALYLDIDRFKQVNDSLGHEIGDRLLQSVAQRLRDCVRATDTVSRQGGDEFVVLLSEVERAEDAAVSAEKIRLALAAPHRIDQHHLRVTVSIGIATYPDDGDKAEALLQNADFAMYHAKDSGRNNHKFFRADMNARALEQQSLESELWRALERQEFVLHYQPTINLATLAITGVEALIRWRHPARGLVLPEEFVALAEKSGAIVPIGRWVLREACRQARAWQDARLPPIRIAVNVSAVELLDKNFVAGVEAILSTTGMEAKYLELELTETVLVHDTDSTAVVLRALKNIGVRLALDDFGTGFSSLIHLRRFPIDMLKIDRSFVRNLPTRTGDASIVGALISMADGLRMQVVAEGVETLQQLACLHEQGCPEAQGFYFSHPLGAAAATELLWRGERSAARRASG